MDDSEWGSGLDSEWGSGLDSEWGSGLDSEWGSGLDSEWGSGLDSEADSYSDLGPVQYTDIMEEEATSSALPDIFMDEEISTSTEVSYPPKGTAALTVALPSVAAIVLLLLFACLIIFWKKTLTGKRSNRDSMRTGSNTTSQGFASGKEAEKSKDPPLVELSVTSWNHGTYLSSDEKREEDAQYAESIAKYSSLQTSESTRKDDGCNALDRQQDTRKEKCQTDSGYDVTERTRKGDGKTVPNSQTDNDYSALIRSSANTSDYDKLDKTRRSYEVENISPDDYNVLQPQEKN
ncbi:hypothetical protein HOLleu_20025 [Holothuria leucospilota]|uniref:Uncharacterized protein n=1 Tax=Holothuria leucospilota TaxID=206669 RepID=A0A9Q1C0T9_HOLLE|nr:hypothetical protein HOLleu_20025 [Holothuria leucospilota]